MKRYTISVKSNSEEKLLFLFYGESSLSEKTKVSPFADVITKATLFPQLFKDPECWSGRGFESATSRTVARDAQSTEPVGGWLSWLVCWLSVFTSKQF